MHYANFGPLDFVGLFWLEYFSDTCHRCADGNVCRGCKHGGGISLNEFISPANKDES